MANKFWGGVVNALLPGTPYNRHTGQYGQTALRNSLISGVVNQVNPIAGALAQAGFNQTAPQQAWNAGLQGYEGMAQQFADARRDAQSYQPTMSVPNVGMTMGGPAQMQANSPMGQMMQPSMAGWDQRMADAMQGISGRISAAYAAQPAYNATQGVRDRGQGHTGDAARSIFQGLSDASRFSSTPQSFGDYTQRWA